MKKTLSLMLALALFIGCKDEFNIPETNSYIDGIDPQISITKPEDGTTFNKQDSIPIEFSVVDDYELSRVDIKIRESLSGLDVFQDSAILSDTLYEYSKLIDSLVSDEKEFEVIVTASDLVGNRNSSILLFSVSE